MCHHMHQIRHTVQLTIPGSDTLDRAIRAAFVAKGTTLNAWCISNGFRRQTVDKAIKGMRQSHRSQELVKLLLRDALGVDA